MKQNKKIKISFRKIFLLAFFLLVATILIIRTFSYWGSFLQKSDHVTKVYFADNISAAHAKLIKKFNQKFSGKIELVAIDLPFSKFSTNERKELLTRAMRSKSDLIDIFAVDIIWIPRFAKWAEPLDAYFRRVHRNNLLQHAIESCYFDGQLVAMPFYIDVGLMYYRQDLLEKHPDYEALQDSLKNSISWERFVQLSSEMPGYDKRFYIFPALNYEGLICSFLELVNEKNFGIFYREPIKLNVAPVQKSLQFLVNLVHKYNISPVDISSYDEFRSFEFANSNNVPFVRGWPGDLRHYGLSLEDTSNFRHFKIAPLPHFKGQQAGSVFGGWNLMISKQSKKKWAAYKFMQFCMEEQSQQIIYESGGIIPVNLQIYNNKDFLQRHPELVTLRNIIDKGIHRPYTENYTKISDIISYFAHLAIKGDLAVNEALQKAENAINSDQAVIQ